MELDLFIHHKLYQVVSFNHFLIFIMPEFKATFIILIIQYLPTYIFTWN